MATETPTAAPAAPKKASIVELEKKLAQAKNAQNKLQATWQLNKAFYQGHQWLFWNRNRLDRPRLEPWRQMITDNRIIGIVRTEIAKMTKAKPAWTIVPTTADDSDLQASLTGEKILEYLWRHLDMRQKLLDALVWSRITGAGFWKIYWDSSQGDKVSVVMDPEGQVVAHPVTGAPLTPKDCPEGMPEGHYEKVLATGDVAIEVVSPFEIFIDPVAKELTEAEWLIQVNVKSPEYVLDHYGVKLVGDTAINTGISETSLMPEGGTSSYKGVKLHEYWAKPSTQYPQGQRVVWVKGEVLHEEANPYKALPFVMFKGISVPGNLWPTSIVEQLRGPQMELNKVKSQIAENANKLGNPAMLLAKQANAQVSGKPGELIHYDDTVPNAIPSYLQPPAMPQYVLQQQDRIESSMQDISGQHEVSSAQVPAGVTAASAINLLMEADDTRLGPAIYDMEETLGKGGQILLKLIARYWTTERTIMISGEDQAWDVMMFKGAALKENTHVEVQSGSSFPQSKAAKQAAIQNVLSLALQYSAQPLNPRDLRKVLHDYDAGGLEALFGDLTTDEAQINRENGQMSQGAELKINSYDDHQSHIDGHTEYQKGSTYQLFPPETKEHFEKHVVEHRQMLMRSMPPPQMGAPEAPEAGGSGGPPKGEEGPTAEAGPPSIPGHDAPHPEPAAPIQGPPSGPQPGGPHGP